jgi:type IV secretion system protein VirB1
MNGDAVDAATFFALALACAPQVHPGTAHAVVAVESAFNPYAIGVVSGSLERQPRTRAEALATISALKAGGWNYSVGLGQINVSNFSRLGLTPQTALDPCTNLGAMQAVLTECHARASTGSATQAALRRTLSCYYSGNFSTGMRHGYVARVVGAASSQTKSSHRKRSLAKREESLS